MGSLEGSMGRRKEDVSVRMLRSGFGKQVVSSALSSPCVGFGTSVRDSSLKVRAKLRLKRAQSRAMKPFQSFRKACPETNTEMTAAAIRDHQASHMQP
jgi:hypothetical protein